MKKELKDIFQDDDDDDDDTRVNLQYSPVANLQGRNMGYFQVRYDS